ncbi:MAG: endonuclease [Geminicoccaceae bacterium]|nr:MAG: endonuclease [Geminicoccaceae bacterium]
MKLVNWNIEWMNDWFIPIREGGPAWRDSNPGRGIADVRGLAERVASVIRDLRPDVLTVQEGPSRRGEMELFVDAHLDGGFDVFGPTGNGSQRLYTLVRRNGPVEAAARLWPEPDEIDFAEPWQVDITGDLILDSYDFTRAPLVIVLQIAGRTVVLVNIHSKSKFIHDGRRLWQNEGTRPQFVTLAVRNRRRIAAELMRVREWLEARLHADPEARLVVAGDLNDGPGVDYFEKNYLINNVVSVVAGNPFNPREMFRHAFIDREMRHRNWTARFDDFIDNIRDRPLLLDHILLAPSVYWGALRNAQIEHDAFERQLRPGSGRESRPSDHRPQSAALEFG